MTNESYKPRTSRAGIHINGWTVSWPVLFAAFAIGSNAVVMQYRVGQIEHIVNTPSPIGERMVQMEADIEQVSREIRWHRQFNHGMEHKP